MTHSVQWLGLDLIDLSSRKSYWSRHVYHFQIYAVVVVGFPTIGGPVLMLVRKLATSDECFYIVFTTMERKRQEF